MNDSKNAVEQALSLVEAAQSKSTFKLADVIKGFGYPEDTIEIYTDSDSAYRLSKLNDELIAADEEESKKLELEAEELANKIIKSKLIFHMRGIDQKQIELLEKQAKAKNEDDDDSMIVDYICALVAANIVKVEDANGNVDETHFTGDDIINLRGTLAADSWNLLVETMQKLSLASGYFKGLTDAGFLQKS